MKYKNYMIYEVLCVVLLFCFIVWVCATHSGGTQKSADEVAAPVISSLRQDQMSKKTNADAGKAFGIDLDKTDGIAIQLLILIWMTLRMISRSTLQEWSLFQMRHFPV